MESDLIEAASTLLAVPTDDTHIGDRQHGTNAIGNRPGQVEADGGVGNVGGADEGVEGTGNQRDPHELGLAVLKHPDGDAQEGKQGQSLVGPGKVTPQDVEAVGVELGEHQDHSDQGKHRNRQGQAFAIGSLVDVQSLR